jgi:hypothetical protein
MPVHAARPGLEPLDALYFENVVRLGDDRGKRNREVSPEVPVLFDRIDPFGHIRIRRNGDVARHFVKPLRRGAPGLCRIREAPGQARSSAGRHFEVLEDANAIGWLKRGPLVDWRLPTGSGTRIRQFFRIICGSGPRTVDASRYR